MAAYYYNLYGANDDTLGELNNCQPKLVPTLFVKDMELNLKYQIKSVKKIKTKYGDRVVLVIDVVGLGPHQLFLPERFQEISQDTLDKMNTGGFYIINQGPLGRSYILFFNKDQ